MYFATFRVMTDFLVIQPPLYKIGHSLISEVVLGEIVTGNFGVLKEAF